MGLFDFLNPKKKIEKLLQDKVMGPVLEKAMTSIKEKGEEKAKEEIKAFAVAKCQEHANSTIPGPLQKYSDKIIDKVAGNVAEKAFDMAKEKVLGVKGATA